MRLTGTIAGLLLVVFIECAFADETPAPAKLNAKEIAHLAFPGVVLLKLNDSSGREISLGSGFFVRQGLVATNLHVLGKATGGEAVLVGGGEPMRIASIERIDATQDLALLRVEPSLGEPLALGDAAQPEVGEEIFVIGNPEGFEGTLSVGIISGLREIEGMRVIQMTAPISQGSSGGPVLDTNGKVIGIAVALWSEGQNINFAVPVKHLHDMLRFVKE